MTDVISFVVSVALDMQLYLSELFVQRGMFVRGLAHPITFASKRKFDAELRGRTAGLTPQQGSTTNLGPGNFEDFGAVVVTPRNYYRLLQTGQNVLLFPGGAKEALSGDQSYPLHWPTTKTDFVRTAARFNATIVPLSAIGMVESFNVLLEPKDILNVPIIGDWAREQNRNMSRARYDSKPDDEIVGFPLALPSIPQRNYFLFGQPIDTTNIDPNDDEACSKIYKMAQYEVRSGIDELLQARQRDPFKDSIQRIAYERIFRTKAPTFPIEILNKRKVS
jgi:hypothetical protein